MVALLVVGALTTGCVPPIPEPVVTTTTPPEQVALVRAREVIAPAAADVALQALDTARRVDFVRHEVERGPAMRQARDEALALAASLQLAATELRDLAAMDRDIPPPVGRAAIALAEDALAVAQATVADVGELDELLAVDDQMAAVVVGWSGRGSRSEAAAQLGELAGQVDALQLASRSLGLIQGGCLGMRDNRIRWAAVLQDRTARLLDLALAADGTAYDDALERFLVAHYREDRVAADGESRACWAGGADVLSAASAVERRLDEVESALAG